MICLTGKVPLQQQRSIPIKSVRRLRAALTGVHLLGAGVFHAHAFDGGGVHCVAGCCQIGCGWL